MLGQWHRPTLFPFTACAVSTTRSDYLLALPSQRLFALVLLLLDTASSPDEPPPTEPDEPVDKGQPARGGHRFKLTASIRTHTWQ